jgi:hypothetical protein
LLAHSQILFSVTSITVVLIAVPGIQREPSDHDDHFTFMDRRVRENLGLD